MVMFSANLIKISPRTLPQIPIIAILGWATAVKKQRIFSWRYETIASGC